MKWGIIAWLMAMTLLLTACGNDSGRGSGSSSSATLYWEPPTTNVDGSNLIDLAGYKVYSSTISGNYTAPIYEGSGQCQDSGGKTECTYTVEGLNPGEYYFAVTAYDISGNESDFSNEVRKVIQ